MYSPETKAEIERIRVLLPTIPNDDAHKQERIDVMKRVVALIREGRVSAAVSSAASKARKAKAVVVDGDSLLADLESSLGDAP